MMQPPFVLLALVYALVRSAGALPPANAPIALAVSALEQSTLVTDQRHGANTCGHVTKNSCDPNATGGGWCCSKHGFCGNGQLYCGKGCQGKYGKCDLGDEKNRPPKVQFCGPKHRDQHCSSGDCCSADGLCGASVAFCGAGCQSKFGKCDKDKAKIQQKCGPKHDNKICPTGQCCSHAGNCGTGKDFCSVPLNCQRKFGLCDSDHIPAGYNMSTDPRRQKGEVQYGTVITRCEVPRSIALTFDDGPSKNTEELLDILKKANAKATFFIAGNTNGKGPIDGKEKWTKVIKRMVEEGHQVGSHTWSHPNMDKIGSDARKDDMFKNERALTNVLGKYPTYMRPPYLHCTEPQGCLADMKELGYHIISYSHDSGDWLHPDDLNKMKERVDSAFAETSQDGNMLLIQHDTIHKSAIELTKHVLQKVQQRGWHAMPVGQCLGDEPQSWYREPLWITPATRAKKGCVVSGAHFCGKLHHFNGRKQCFESNHRCHKDADKCKKEVHTDKAACQKMEKICTMHFLYCTECGDLKHKEPKNKHSCEIKHFMVNKQE